MNRNMADFVIGGLIGLTAGIVMAGAGLAVVADQPVNAPIPQVVAFDIRAVPIVAFSPDCPTWQMFLLWDDGSVDQSMLRQDGSWTPWQDLHTPLVTKVTH